MSAPLPPGQFEYSRFPRFGLGKFAARFPAAPERIRFRIAGDVECELLAETAFAALPRVEQRSDFHCVTSWSISDCRWSGVRFTDFHAQLVQPLARPLPGAELVVLRGEDGYCTSLPLADLLRDDVLLADRLNGEGLGIEHGAPLRLVAPAHYGYKNVKHIVAIEFWRDARAYRFPFPYPSFMDHPRARVALEERGKWFPGWMLRVYRLIIPLNVALFALALAAYRRRRLS